MSELVLELEGRHAQDGVFVVGLVRENNIKNTFPWKEGREEGRGGGRKGGREGGREGENMCEAKALFFILSLIPSLLSSFHVYLS